MERKNSEPAKQTDEAPDLHPAWKSLIDYCRRLQHGDIERLRIQDGVPVIAEIITRKIKFSR